MNGVIKWHRELLVIFTASGGRGDPKPCWDVHSLTGATAHTQRERPSQILLTCKIFPFWWCCTGWTPQVRHLNKWSSNLCLRCVVSAGWVLSLRCSRSPNPLMTSGAQMQRISYDKVEKWSTKQNVLPWWWICRGVVPGSRFGGNPEMKESKPASLTLKFLHFRTFTHPAFWNGLFQTLKREFAWEGATQRRWRQRRNLSDLTEG